VLSVHDWAVDALRQYVEEVCDGFEPGVHPALWVTERRSRISERQVNARFASYRDAAGLRASLMRMAIVRVASGTESRNMITNYLAAHPTALVDSDRARRFPSRG
jgi:site-specific recombinase XerD